MPRLRSSKAVLSALFLFSLIAVVAFGAAASWGDLWIKAAALLVGIPAISLAIACFWTIPVRHFSGAAAAAGIGAISTIGNLGGVATLNMMPAIAIRFDAPSRARWVPSVGMVVIALDRKSVEQGRDGSVRVDLGGGRD